MFLDVRGHRATNVRRDDAVEISLISHARGRLSIRLNAEFSIREPGSVAGPEARELASDLIYRDLTEAVVEASGTLTLAFEGGLTVTAPPDATRIAWELRSRDYFVSCLPGDEGLVGWGRFGMASSRS